MDQALPPFASTGWALAVGSMMLWPVLLLGLGLSWLAVIKHRLRLALSLVVAVFACPLFAALLWVSVNWLGYGGGDASSPLAIVVDRAAIVAFVASVLVIAGSGLFFLFRVFASRRQRMIA